MEPIIETEHFYFVKPSSEFIDFYIENMNNPEIYRWITSNPITYTYEDEVNWVEISQNMNNFTIVFKDTFEPVGNCSIEDIDSESVEFGIWIDPRYHNNHYGREIIRAMIDYTFNVIGRREIIIVAFENNVRAIKCYQSMNFVTYKIVDGVKDGMGNDTRDVYMRMNK